ncbi:MAG: hypothetical protein IJ716_08360 [Lachnospiraceae bacterium]|nr:hypothetical protein [Lachnospiraceae bacterium]MBR1743960.1 hypothetical protein [Lachnospiraceae bacterium]
MNTNYSQFYKGSEQISNTSSDQGKKDTVVRYEFNTTDEKGNKVTDKMSNEETMRTLNDISSQYGDNVIVEFSGDGLAALNEHKGKIPIPEEPTREIPEEMITFFDKSANYLPEYSGIYSVDKAIATAVENCSKEEQAFVYDIIRQNFLMGNRGDMTEGERQANISLGMKKAEYAAGSFISQESKKAFLDAMESVAKLASAGKADEAGNMNYGVKKGNYLGHGSNLVYTTDGLDMMKTMDAKAYEEYQKISRESSNADRPLNALRYLTNWYADSVKKNPNMIVQYEKQSDEHVEKKVNNQKLDKTFADIQTENKAAFIESLKAFQNKNPAFLVSIINRELALAFWGK